MVLSYRDVVADKVRPLIAYRPEDTSVFVVGSLSVGSKATYNHDLSDIDLLIVPSCDSLNAYVSHIEQAISISKALNGQDNWVVDVFFMSRRIAGKYFKLLPIIAGGRSFSDLDVLFGKAKDADPALVIPSEATRRALYEAKAKGFLRDYIHVLPVADTSRARHTVKHVLRGLSFVICANAATEKLAEIEESLMIDMSFENVGSLLKETLGVELPEASSLEEVYRGVTVDDWPDWMISQDRIARVLIKLERNLSRVPSEERLYDGLAKVRDLLNKKLKDVVNEGGASKVVEEYVNLTASVVAELALAGVSDLGDLEAESVPTLVKESYPILVAYLQGEVCSLRCLAAAVVILEYSLERCIAYLNLTLANQRVA